LAEIIIAVPEIMERNISPMSANLNDLGLYFS